ncbi:hypothetical protein BC828DRAFT_407865 [Blastocladiella britannica]|nr:hypothetical protein BC828DRAFT_407865 [Blastocladiella britannica]
MVQLADSLQLQLGELAMTTFTVRVAIQSIAHGACGCITLMASALLLWLTRLHSHSRIMAAVQGTGAAPDAISPPTPRQRHFMRLAHTNLLATSAFFMLATANGILFMLPPFTRDPYGAFPRATADNIRIASFILTICTGVASFVAQTAGEVTLVTKFCAMYPSRRARWRVLPLVAIAVAVRMIAQGSVYLLSALEGPTPAISSTFPRIIRIAGMVSNLAMTTIVLLLSATIVVKLAHRWLRQSKIAVHQDGARSKRILGILSASAHHTVFTATAALVMTFTFRSIGKYTELLSIINSVATVVYKLSFSIGLAQALYHMAYNSSATPELVVIAAAMRTNNINGTLRPSDSGTAIHATEDRLLPVAAAVAPRHVRANGPVRATAAAPANLQRHPLLISPPPLVASPRIPADRVVDSGRPAGASADHLHPRSTSTTTDRRGATGALAEFVSNSWGWFDPTHHSSSDVRLGGPVPPPLPPHIPGPPHEPPSSRPSSTAYRTVPSEADSF